VLNKIGASFAYEYVILEKVALEPFVVARFIGPFDRMNAVTTNRIAN